MVWRLRARAGGIVELKLRGLPGREGAAYPKPVAAVGCRARLPPSGAYTYEEPAPPPIGGQVWRLGDKLARNRAPPCRPSLFGRIFRGAYRTFSLALVSAPVVQAPLRFPLATCCLALAWAGCGREPETARRAGAAIEGVDVSHHQVDVDWCAVAAEGIDFAFVKATEGATHVDTRFCDNWDETDDAGLARGAYHFFRADVDARRQFDLFRTRVQLAPGDLTPVVDVETTDGASEAELVEGLRTWLYLAEIHYGIRPVVYTNQKFYYRHLAGHFDDYPLWIARYGTTAPSVSTAATVSIWQYGSRGRVAGIDGDVDLNVFTGGVDDFARLRLRERAAVVRWDPLRPRADPGR